MGRDGKAVTGIDLSAGTIDISITGDRFNGRDAWPAAAMAARARAVRGQRGSREYA